MPEIRAHLEVQNKARVTQPPPLSCSQKSDRDRFSFKIIDCRIRLHFEFRSGGLALGECPILRLDMPEVAAELVELLLSTCSVSGAMGSQQPCGHKLSQLVNGRQWGNYVRMGWALRNALFVIGVFRAVGKSRSRSIGASASADHCVAALDARYLHPILFAPNWTKSLLSTTRIPGAKPGTWCQTRHMVPNQAVQKVQIALTSLASAQSRLRRLAAHMTTFPWVRFWLGGLSRALCVLRFS